MENTTKVLRNSFWNTLNTLVNFLAIMVLSIAVARLLGPNSAGVYNFFTWLLNSLIIISIFGGNLTIIKYSSQFLEEGYSKVGGFFRWFTAFQVGFTLIIATLTYLIFFQLNILEADFEKSKIYILWVILSLLPAVLVNSLSSLMQGLQRYKEIFWVSLYSAFFTIPLTLITLLSIKDIELLLIINFLNYILTLIIYFILLKDILLKGLFRSSLKLEKDNKKQILLYAISIYLIAIIDSVVWQKSEVFFLGILSTSDQVAYYSLAYGLASSLILVIAASFSSVLLPIYSQLYIKNASESIKRGYYNSTKLVAAIVIPLSFGLVVIAPTLVNFLYGAEYIGMIPVLGVLLVSITLGAIAGSGSALVYSANKQWFIIKLGLILAVLNIILDLILIPKYMAVGAALANVAVQSLGVIIGIIYIVKVLKVRFPLQDVLKIFFASMIMVLILILSPFNRESVYFLGYALILGVIVYAFFGYLLRVLNEEDVKILKEIKKKYLG